MVRGVGGVGGGNSPEEWFYSLPPITRSLLVGVLGTTVLCSFGVLSPFQLALIWPRIISKFEVWRLIGAFLFHGTFSFPFVINLYLLVTYSRGYETSPFDTGGGGTSADFAWMLVLGCTLLSILGYVFQKPFMGHSFTFMILYVWTRKNPTQMTSVFSFKMQAFYLPWGLLALNLLIGNDIFMDFLGIVVGHVYYFVHHIAPQSYGMELIRTPQFICELFGVMPAPRRTPGGGLRREAPPPPPARGGHSWGSGQVLGAE